MDVDFSKTIDVEFYIADVEKKSMYWRAPSRNITSEHPRQPSQPVVVPTLQSGFWSSISWFGRVWEIGFVALLSTFCGWFTVPRSTLDIWEGESGSYRHIRPLLPLKFVVDIPVDYPGWWFDRENWFPELWMSFDTLYWGKDTLKDLGPFQMVWWSNLTSGRLGYPESMKSYTKDLLLKPPP